MPSLRVAGTLARGRRHSQFPWLTAPPPQACAWQASLNLWVRGALSKCPLCARRRRILSLLLRVLEDEPALEEVERQVSTKPTCVARSKRAGNLAPKSEGDERPAQVGGGRGTRQDGYDCAGITREGPPAAVALAAAVPTRGEHTEREEQACDPDAESCEPIDAPAFNLKLSNSIILELEAD